ncbi:unnamed protein product [Dracunculus medinensis]|uniref:ENTH domain-containing protein n=1 Tax=Dracunculus medinensis TaxID=318479 RepID=A0A158Q3A0_DRAME|nr:unnamed protein product [Dracunculus medinensis]
MSDLLSGLANFTKSVTGSLNTYEIRKQGMVMNYTGPEVKVREATNEDPWGPTGPQMAEIANLSFQYDAFPEIMGMLWKRMFQENKYAWRRVYKSLTLLNYLVKNGSERVIGNARDHIFEMRNLESYRCIDEKGKDQGINVRHRARLLIELIQDDELLRTERRKAKIDGKEKYLGYSKEDMCFGKATYGRPIFAIFFIISKINCQFQNREVNSFQFPDDDSRNGRDSPELGIREVNFFFF